MDSARTSVLELDFLDLLRGISRFRLLIAASALLGGVAGLVLHARAPVRFAASGILHMHEAMVDGKVIQLITPYELMHLIQKHGEERLAPLNATIHSMNVVQTSSTLLNVDTWADTPEHASKALEAVLDTVRPTYAALIESLTKSQRDRLSQLDLAVAEIETERKNAASSRARSDSGSAAVIRDTLLYMERSRLLNERANLEMKFQKPEGQLLSYLVVHPAENSPVSPASRGRFLIGGLLCGFLFGLLAPMFSAFLRLK